MSDGINKDMWPIPVLEFDKIQKGPPDKDGHLMIKSDIEEVKAKIEFYRTRNKHKHQTNIE